MLSRREAGSACSSNERRSEWTKRIPSIAAPCACSVRVARLSRAPLEVVEAASQRAALAEAPANASEPV